MTDPSTDFEGQLKASFDARAEQAPPVDLADAALRHAARIRTRRRVAAGVAAFTAVAVVIPVGVRLADDPGERPTASDPTDQQLPAPDVVAVAIDGLPHGAATTVPHLAGNAYVDSAETQPLPPSDRVRTDAVALDDGVLVFEKDEFGRVDYLPVPGGRSALPTGSESTNPAVDSEDGSVAFAVHPNAGAGATSGDTLVLTKSVNTPEATTSTGSMRVEQVMGVKQGEIVFNAREGGQRVVGRVQVLSGDATVEQPWPDVATVTAIDPDFTRMAAVLDADAGGRTACASMLAYSDASEEWESCTWRPVEFSHDGSRVLAVFSRGDGLGPNQMAVLDADTGETIQQFATEGTFGRLTFEDSDTVVGVVSVDGESAIVRCTVGGSCELTTDPVRVAQDEPDSVLEPYQVTAN
jgi:hypothetical protein